MPYLKETFGFYVPRLYSVYIWRCFYADIKILIPGEKERPLVVVPAQRYDFLFPFLLVKNMCIHSIYYYGERGVLDWRNGKAINKNPFRAC